MPRLLALTTVLAWPLATGCGLARRAAEAAGKQQARLLFQSIQAHPDPATVGEALPAFLLLLDSFVAGNPEDPELLLSAANGYNAYCQAFLGDREQEERAHRLYARARDYGLRVLRRNERFAGAEDGPIEDFEAALETFEEGDLPALQATGAAWLGYVITGAGSMEVLAELPRAMAVMERVSAIDETYGNGSAHLVYAVYYAVQPRGAGQDLDKSRQHFARAIELAKPADLLPRVLQADLIGRATLDEAFFTRELEAVLERDVEAAPDHRFANQLAQDRARRLLEERSEIF